jgi:hypothetical protein
MMPYDPFPLGLLVICLVFLYFVWPRADFTFTVCHGKSSCFGKLPVHLRQILEDFLTKEMEGDRSFKVQGSWHKKRLRLSFRGDLTVGERQRIRNLLVNS